MKFLLDNWFLVALALASGAMIFIPALRGRSAAAGISPSAAVILINREKAQVVDVCDKAEYDAGHLPAAKHIALADLETKLASTVKNKTNPLILVCASGVRSAKAQAIAQKLGYEKAVSLQGGVAAWKAANYPVEKSA
jgi:rhodanese-related sulfurtransferase